jgi:ketosteroid isomerase-like protein
MRQNGRVEGAMTARTPADVDRLFAEAISRGDLDAALACYEAEAALVPQPGQVVRGTAALREAAGGLIALRGPLAITVEEVVEAGELALLRSRWTLRGTGPDGQPVELAGAGAEVMRRQADGSWRFVIDHPFAAMPAQS